MNAKRELQRALLSVAQLPPFLRQRDLQSLLTDMHPDDLRMLRIYHQGQLDLIDLEIDVREHRRVSSYDL